MKKFGVSSNIELKFKTVTPDGLFGDLYGLRTLRDKHTLGFFEIKILFDEIISQVFFFLIWFVPLVFRDFMARAGQASTQMLQVLPRHFSLLNSTVSSLFVFIASTGQSAMQVPQLKHFSVLTWICLGTVTVTPRCWKASAILVSISSGISIRISPPLLLIWAERIAMGTLYSIMIWAAMGSAACSSLTRMSNLAILCVISL